MTWLKNARTLYSPDSKISRGSKELRRMWKAWRNCCIWSREPFSSTNLKFYANLLSKSFSTVFWEFYRRNILHKKKVRKENRKLRTLMNRFSPNSADSLRVYKHLLARVQDSRTPGNAAQSGNEQVSQQIPRGKAAAFGSSAGFRRVAPRGSSQRATRSYRRCTGARTGTETGRRCACQTKTTRYLLDT